MRRIYISLVALAVGLVVIGGWLLCRNIFSNEELASKPEWAAIQIISLQRRDKPTNRIEFVTVDRYSIVGLPVDDTRRKIWIMLNPRNPPYYKQLPVGSYSLSKDEFKAILGSGVVTSTVEKCLESHLEEP